MGSSEKATLVRMSEEHLKNTYHWLRSSPLLRAQIDCLDPPTINGNQAYWRARWQDTSREDYAIMAGTHVGNCGLVGIDRRRHKAELWIYLGTYYGSGIGTVALHQLLARGFHQLGLHRIWVRVAASNPGAADFYARNGFIVEGRLRDDTIQNGEWIDFFVMSMLFEEFVGEGGQST